ncbi:MAG: acetyl-CoA carboxylase carboxyltransferase subunit alpha [Candidatus Eremiobacteraeota bacterium]|nr:acetyl-CoA carboxylase carboxyltransferase subunit alpha [Candidatus Eremiobacteraeota bacterium]MBV8203539.1 acetyl-CoA carboxylase carboxyltransferase subunit alpha [Candidatus Eremiobacteraeota bacterium]MBV8262740.1 acetyl-CoA carboxylase carboxyltransferase subunit alpha [Candidatus Eremiobacteraeota bacterium]MBV8338989.1 acetyl-CoA carboxylase carboxyltransferase subunit alpha [Candidatus Eremiobacteraeota bacterium]MBV8460998.1 acetyl-CoA carboxylase carboxyltransferase subunit alpha
MNVIVELEKPLVELETKIAGLKKLNETQRVDFSAEIAALEEKARQLKLEIFGNPTPWQRVHLARHPKRPLAMDYISALDGFTELHGDRGFRDDPAVVAGYAYLDDLPIFVIGEQKGRDTKDNLYRNFGMPHPEGYRKAQRIMRLAEKFRRPLVTFIDTPGAYPGIGAEERGQSEAIAASLKVLAGLRTPVIVNITGEGGSGGALAIGIGDHIIMLQHSIYSVASPEAAASILWRDASRAEEAAQRLRLTSDELFEFGIVDEVIPEPLGGAHQDPQRVIHDTLAADKQALRKLLRLSQEALVDRRYEKFRRIGAHVELVHDTAAR